MSQAHTGIHGDQGQRYGSDGLGAGYDPVFADLVRQRAAGARNETQMQPLTDAPMLEASALVNDTATVQRAKDATPEPEGVSDKRSEAGTAAPGTADGRNTLLEQIARCLPPNERPELKAASLHLSVDGGGHLTAAPRLEVDVTQLTQTQLRSANQIVQAAMQCAPYVVTEGEVAMIDIVPDFSGVPLAGQ